MFLHTSSNLFELSVVYAINMSANMNLGIPVILLLRIFLLLFIYRFLLYC